jgi:hypothetical protein
MLRTALQVTGLARALGNFKLRMEAKAEDAVKQVKGVAVRIAIAAALAVAALIFVLLALVVGLVALYAYLEPIYGVLPALGIIAASLAVLALVLLLVASLIGRSRPAKTKAAEAADDSAGDMAYARRPATRREYATREARAAAEVVDSLDSLTALPRNARKRGGAEEPTVDAVTLLQSGDRRTMAAVLGAVVAIGWILGRTLPIHR